VSFKNKDYYENDSVSSFYAVPYEFVLIKDLARQCEIFLFVNNAGSHVHSHALINFNLIFAAIFTFFQQLPLK
jgi:hypothetical protein